MIRRSAGTTLFFFSSLSFPFSVRCGGFPSFFFPSDAIVKKMVCPNWYPVSFFPLFFFLSFRPDGFPLSLFFPSPSEERARLRKCRDRVPSPFLFCFFPPQNQHSDSLFFFFFFVGCCFFFFSLFFFFFLLFFFWVFCFFFSSFPFFRGFMLSSYFPLFLFSTTNCSKRKNVRGGSPSFLPPPHPRTSCASPLFLFFFSFWTADWGSRNEDSWNSSP